MGNLSILIACFVGVGSLVLLVATLLGTRRATTDSRVADVAESQRRFRRLGPGVTEFDMPQGALPRVGKLILPKQREKQERIVSRLHQAGIYRRHSIFLFMALKFLLLVVPMVVGVGLSLVGNISLSQGILTGAAVGLVGYLGPTLWLSHLKSKRQRDIRRALPDALDVIVVCMEGGLSLTGALARVSTELNQAHPLLAEEMAIVRREIQLGRSTGDALRQFADRFDAEELRSLASVVKQAERYGASLAKALTVHAETLRLKRYQSAEAMAQKAPVKLIFPTVLCIFPALYIVLMGPAGVHLLELLDNLGGP